MVELVLIKVEPETRDRIKEISKVTGLKMYAVVEQAVKVYERYGYSKR
ncbi:hypothetical protein [Methanolobus vulcani]|nr:hypothetical protein [Methanolobus vulcani]